MEHRTTPSLERLAGDAALLVSRAVDQQSRLALLVRALEGHAVSTPRKRLPFESHYAVTRPAKPAQLRVDLLASARELLENAHTQRELGETILAGLAATPGAVDRLGTSRPVVLVVDDSAETRELHAALLESEGFRVVTAMNGLDGLVVAHYTRPAVVLMDIVMPVLDGLEATRLLKASPITRQMAVIACTGRTDTDSAAYARLFADILRKPSSPEAIVRSIRRFAAPAD